MAEAAEPCHRYFSQHFSSSWNFADAKICIKKVRVSIDYQPPRYTKWNTTWHASTSSAGCIGFPLTFTCDIRHCCSCRLATLHSCIPAVKNLALLSTTMPSNWRCELRPGDWRPKLHIYSNVHPQPTETVRKNTGSTIWVIFVFTRPMDTVGHFW